MLNSMTVKDLSYLLDRRKEEQWEKFKNIYYLKKLCEEVNRYVHIVQHVKFSVCS